MKTKKCKCGKERPIFVFDKKKKCDHCRGNEAQKKSKRHRAGWDEIRMRRNVLIAETDWTQLADVPDEISDSYVEYRQALRDITKSCDDPADVVFPNKPE